MSTEDHSFTTFLSFRTRVMNFTISVPKGTTNHGNPQLLCLPSGWTDIVTFLVTNYYAHAATVFLEPGIASRRTATIVFTALVLPFSGISRAVYAIWRHAVTERTNPLKRAARSRALCMVMKVPKSGPYNKAVRTVRLWGQPKEKVLAYDLETAGSLTMEGPTSNVKVRDVEPGKNLYDPVLLCCCCLLTYFDFIVGYMHPFHRRPGTL